MRDWLYVEDHCKGIDLVLRQGTVGEVYNIGGFNEESNINIVKQVIAIIARIMHEEPEYPAEIAIDDFFKCKIQVARVLACEKVEKSSKLLKFRLGLGKDGERTVVSGIRKWYEPEPLVGTQVAVITNLKPAKLAGIESQGMILSAMDDNGNLRLVSVGEGVEDGAIIG